MNYEELSLLLKAIADPNRLKILELISCNGKRACEILEFFDFTQPTLSHHMKTLTQAKIVNKSQDGRWIFYTINTEIADQLNHQLSDLLTDTDGKRLFQMMVDDKTHKEEYIK